MKRIIYTVVAAAAVLTGSVAAAAPALASNGPGQSISAYYWQPNGHALGGPKAVSPVDLSSGYLAKDVQAMSNANIAGAQIEIQGTITGGPFTDQNGGGGPTPPTARVFFTGGSAGTNANSPDGYLSQPWWAQSSSFDLQQASSTTGTFDLTIQADPSAGWSNWNGQTAAANPDLFNAAASHVRQLGLSFGGGWFFENGVQGAAGSSLTVTHIYVNGVDVLGS